MNAARDPEEVLASIRRLVAKEVRHAKEREASERPDRGEMPVVSERASAAARLVLGAEARVAANGLPDVLQDPVRTDAGNDADAAEDLPPAAAKAPADPFPVSGANVRLPDEAALRELIREVLRDEVRTRMGPRISAMIRRIVQEELAQLFPGQNG